MSDAVAPPTAPAAAPNTADLTGYLDRDVACRGCGYNLRGLLRDGACPECGSPVARSLESDLLEFASPAYLETLHKGVFLILTGVILQILSVIGSFVVGFSVSALGRAGIGAMVLVQVCSTAFLLIELYGWWLFSEADPGYTGRNTGQTPRRIVRITLMVQAPVVLVQLVVQNLAGPPAPGATISGIQALLLGLSVILGLSYYAAAAVSYFAKMLYVRWLAPRIPSEHVYRRSKLLMWLGPVLCTVGLLLFMLGPLIALVMYWNMLDIVRRDLKAIRARVAPLPPTPVV